MTGGGVVAQTSGQVAQTWEGEAMRSWQEQLERVERFLRRIEDGDQDGTDYEDFLWSFFQNCWHLKDWIMNDPAVPEATQNLVRERIHRNVKSTSETLAICADLANRSKHLTLDKFSRKDADIPGRVWTARVGGSDAGTTWYYRVTWDDGSERDALELARKAVCEWKQLLTAWGLLQVNSGSSGLPT